MSKPRVTKRAKLRRYRVHFRELGYYQSVVEASDPRSAARRVQEAPPQLTFISIEEREVVGVDELRKNKTWKPLPIEFE